MPRAIPSAPQVFEGLKRVSKNRLNEALAILKRICDDLDPSFFTSAEYLEEFDGTRAGRCFYNGVSLLIKEGYVEKVRGGYQVTELGLQLEEYYIE